MHAKRSHMHVKDPVVPGRVRWTMETINNPACTKNDSNGQLCGRWSVMEEEEEEEAATAETRGRVEAGSQGLNT